MTYYLTCIGLKDEDVERVKKVCSDIFKKDKTFLYAVNDSMFKKYDKVLRVRSESKDQAHKRGTILVKKYFEGMNLVYWVKEVSG